MSLGAMDYGTFRKSTACFLVSTPTATNNATLAWLDPLLKGYKRTHGVALSRESLLQMIQGIRNDISASTQQGPIWLGKDPFGLGARMAEEREANRVAGEDRKAGRGTIQNPHDMTGGVFDRPPRKKTSRKAEVRE